MRFNRTVNALGKVKKETSLCTLELGIVVAMSSPSSRLQPVALETLGSDACHPVGKTGITSFSQHFYFSKMNRGPL